MVLCIFIAKKTGSIIDPLRAEDVQFTGLKIQEGVQSPPSPPINLHPACNCHNHSSFFTMFHKICCLTLHCHGMIHAKAVDNNQHYGGSCCIISEGVTLNNASDYRAISDPSQGYSQLDRQCIRLIIRYLTVRYSDNRMHY